MQFAALLHALNNIWHALERLLHRRAGSVEVLDQVLGVSKLLFPLIDCEVSILTLQSIKLVQQQVETLLVCADLL